MSDFSDIDYTAGSTLYIRATRLSDVSAYNIDITDNGDGTYTPDDMPAAAGLGQYDCVLYRQLGDSQDPDNDMILMPLGVRIYSGSEFHFDNAVHAAMGTYQSAFMNLVGIRT